jgi:gliding motility-associated-like protein
LRFSGSLANSPTGVNLGNPGNNFAQPRDITVINDCDNIFGFVTNEGTNTITRLDFNNGFLAAPVTTDIGNIGSLSFPHSISEVYRTGDAVNFMIPNVSSNSVTRLSFANCSASSIPSFSGITPPTFTYNQPGTYNISLFVDDGLPTQNVFCKNIVVLPQPEADFEFDVDVCDPLKVTFNANSTSTLNPIFNFGDNNSSNTINAVHTYQQPGIYEVEFSVGSDECRAVAKKMIDLRIITENIVITPDTTICLGSTKQLRTESVLDFCWWPTTYLDDPSKANPITSATENITYYFTAKTTGTNLITNSNFSAGNTGFTSDYDYSPGSGVNPGKYNVGANILAWHPGMANCGDHTSGNGNMLMVNGASVAGELVWSQTVNIQPNTTYAFAAWLQHITSVNPAELQFSINGNLLGPVFVANDNSCIWERFYQTWYSGSNTSAVISIVNQNTLEWGNDFALDDLSFAPLQFRRDSVIISVEDPEINTIEDTTICGPNPVTLSTTGAANYSWTPPINLSNPSIGNPIATPSSTTEYFVTGITSNGCIAKDSVTVTLNPELVYTLTADTTICYNTNLQLQATGGTNTVWIPNSTLSDETIPNPIVNPNTLTTYYVTITDNNDCEVNDSVKVDVRPLAVFTVTPNGEMCEKDSLQLGASGGHTYSWLPNTDITDAGINNPLVFPNTTTEYFVTITDTVCNNTANLSTIVTVNSLPVVVAGKSNDLDCTNGFANLSGSGASSYVWSPVEGLNNNLIATPIATPQITTEYIVTGTDDNGCVNKATITVEVSLANKIPLFMPNAFTPNNDGLNDCYGVKYAGSADKFEFSIYNRWGERIFYTKNPSDCWNGKYKGVPQDTGVFVYMVKSEGLCGSKFEKGLFTLIR